MMKIDEKKISAFVDTLRDMVPECRLMITPDGISTLAVDTANVAMVSANLPAAAFEEYKEEKFELGMDVTKWKTAVDLMKSGSIGTCKHGEVRGSEIICRSDDACEYQQFERDHTHLDPILCGKEGAALAKAEEPEKKR
jgi:hypothetical protein